MVTTRKRRRERTSPLPADPSVRAVHQSARPPSHSSFSQQNLAASEQHTEGSSDAEEEEREGEGEEQRGNEDEEDQDGEWESIEDEDEGEGIDKEGEDSTSVPISSGSDLSLDGLPSLREERGKVFDGGKATREAAGRLGLDPGPPATDKTTGGVGVDPTIFRPRASFTTQTQGDSGLPVQAGTGSAVILPPDFDFRQIQGGPDPWSGWDGPSQLPQSGRASSQIYDSGAHSYAAPPPPPPPPPRSRSSGPQQPLAGWNRQTDFEPIPTSSNPHITIISSSNPATFHSTHDWMRAPRPPPIQSPPPNSFRDPLPPRSTTMAYPTSSYPATGSYHPPTSSSSFAPGYPLTSANPPVEQNPHQYQPDAQPGRPLEERRYTPNPHYARPQGYRQLGRIRHALPPTPVQAYPQPYPQPQHAPHQQYEVYQAYPHPKSHPPSKIQGDQTTHSPISVPPYPQLPSEPGQHQSSTVPIRSLPQAQSQPSVEQGTKSLSAQSFSSRPEQAATPAGNELSSYSHKRLRVDQTRPPIKAPTGRAPARRSLPAGQFASKPPSGARRPAKLSLPPGMTTAAFANIDPSSTAADISSSDRFPSVAFNPTILTSKCPTEPSTATHTPVTSTPAETTAPFWRQEWYIPVLPTDPYSAPVTGAPPSAAYPHMPQWAAPEESTSAGVAGRAGRLPQLPGHGLDEGYSYHLQPPPQPLTSTTKSTATGSFSTYRPLNHQYNLQDYPPPPPRIGPDPIIPVMTAPTNMTFENALVLADPQPDDDDPFFFHPPPLSPRSAEQLQDPLPAANTFSGTVTNIDGPPTIQSNIEESSASHAQPQTDEDANKISRRARAVIGEHVIRRGCDSADVGELVRMVSGSRFVLKVI
ncbi:hypothetical protein IAR55_005882 [Kwoniella newhampshirensis]|uniref:Uncharacterized protein n=1 Tax=Kwoniella newhampshirensis TaxID=1651941 RepID=A0AAW0YK06_9TREE